MIEGGNEENRCQDNLQKRNPSMPKKLMRAEEAVNLINSNDTITVCGIAGGITPDKVLAALGGRFVETGEPKRLNMVWPTAVGDGYEIKGMEHIAHEGMIKRIIAGSFTVAKSTERPPKIYEMVVNNKVEAYNLPIGTLMLLHREIAAKRPGLITEVGLGTFLDPRQEGGKMNAVTTEDLIEVITIKDKEYLFYPAFQIDVAIVRGTTADEDGNITMEHEYTFAGNMALAMAARNCGGKVIVQVKRVVTRGSLPPQQIKIPGIFVDALVVDENQMLTTGIKDDPSSCGEIRLPWNSIPMGDFNGIRRSMVRRILLELKVGDVVNLGYGITAFIPQVVWEEGIQDKLIFTTEHGCIGGFPYAGLQFGGAINPQALIDCPSQFDFIDGGGPDVICLSFAELDKLGNVNVTRLKQMPHVLAGAGGFTNLVQNAKKIVFCGTMTAGGVKIELSDGKITLRQAGKFEKIVEKVQQITFNGDLARRKGQKVIYVTDLCVFELKRDGLELIEIAPGLDLQRDILPLIQFDVDIAADLKISDPMIYRPGRMGLRDRKEWRN